MRKFFAVTFIPFALAAGPVLAADMLPPPAAAPQAYYKAPPLPPPSWTGCYINGGGGYGVSTANQHFEAFPGLAGATPPQDNGGSGWMGLAGGGCDYQFNLALGSFWSPNVVIGAFGDYDFMNFVGSVGTAGGLGTMTENTAWAGGLRAGFLASPNVLIYTNGGYTGTHLDSVNFAPVGWTMPSQNLSGWFLGGGVESSLSWILPGLFLRTEYRYSKYQTTNSQLFVTTTGAPVVPGVAYNTNLASQSVFTQLVYRFNWFGGGH